MLRTRRHFLSYEISAWRVGILLLFLFLVFVTFRLFMPSANSLDHLREGMLRSEVEDLLGESDQVLENDGKVELTFSGQDIGDVRPRTLHLYFVDGQLYSSPHKGIPLEKDF